MNIEERVNEQYAHFSESDRAVWQYIAINRRESSELSIDKLAKRCCVSRSAVMRFAQKLGLHGFAELKLFLKMDEHNSSVTDQIQRVRDTYNSVIDNLLKKNCDEIFDAMDKAARLYICGEGMVQSSVKKEFKRIFLSAGRLFYDVPAGKAFMNFLPLMSSQDFCILVSVSGENKVMIETARQLRVHGTKIVSITKNRDNTLAHLCDYHLYIEPVACVRTPIQLQYESVTSYFLLIDILFLKYLEYRRRKEEPHATGNTGTEQI